TEPDFTTTWPPHCRAGTAGAALHPELGDPALDAVFYKGQYDDGYSGFGGTTAPGTAEDGTPDGDGPGGTGLDAWLRERGIGSVDVVGIATDHCVRATALDAARHGFAVRVLLDHTAGVAPGTIAAALDQLTQAGGALAGAMPGREARGLPETAATDSGPTAPAPAPAPVSGAGGTTEAAGPGVRELLRLAVESVGGSERPGQIRMASAVEHAIDTGEHLAVQAGTGTGKS